MDTDLIAVQFVVVKFVRDLVRDEPINVGVVGRVDARLVFRALPNFSRVRRIAGIEDSTALELGLAFLRSTLDRSPEIELTTLIDSATGILRFSDQLVGMANNPQEFLDEQFEIFVSDNAATRETTGENRRTIRDTVRRVMASRGIDADQYSISKQRVRGQTGRHEFDFGFVNGRVTLIKALSLQTREPYALSEARALSFAALDTKADIARIGPDVRIAAVVAPPSAELGGAYEEAMRLVESHADPMIVLGRDDVGRDLAEIFGHDGLQRLSPELLTEAI